MRFITVILFLVLLGCRSLLPIVDYVVNFNYYSEVLCINKNKPELECNGKCQLAKKMAETSEEDSNQKKDSQTVNLKVTDVFIFENINLPKLSGVKKTAVKTLFHYLNLYQFQNDLPIEHPPALSCLA